jgi:hypothetical protein
MHRQDSFTLFIAARRLVFRRRKASNMTPCLLLRRPWAIFPKFAHFARRLWGRVLPDRDAMAKINRDWAARELPTVRLNLVAPRLQQYDTMAK